MQQHSRIKKKRYNAAHLLQIILQWIHSLRVRLAAQKQMKTKKNKVVSSVENRFPQHRNNL